MSAAQHIKLADPVTGANHWSRPVLMDPSTPGWGDGLRSKAEAAIDVRNNDGTIYIVGRDLPADPYADARSQVFTADGATDTFNLSFTPANAEDVLALAGPPRRQTVLSAFTGIADAIVIGSAVVFTSPPPAGPLYIYELPGIASAIPGSELLATVVGNQTVTARCRRLMWTKTAAVGTDAVVTARRLPAMKG